MTITVPLCRTCARGHLPLKLCAACAAAAARVTGLRALHQGPRDPELMDDPR